MGSPLLTKVKKGLLAFIEDASLAELAGYSYVRGVRAGLMRLPSVWVAVTSATPAMEAEGLVPWRVRVEIGVVTKASYDDAGKTEGAEDGHDAAADAVKNWVQPDAVRAFLNSENSANRPVEGFHMGYFLQPSLESIYDAELKAFCSVLIYEMIVEESDGDAA